MARRIDYLTNTHDPEFDKAVENVEALEKARAALHEDRVRNFGDEGTRTLEWLERDGRTEELREAERNLRNRTGFVNVSGDNMMGDLVIGTGIGWSMGGVASRPVTVDHQVDPLSASDFRSAEQMGFISEAIVRPNEQALDRLRNLLSTESAENHRQFLLRNDPYIANSIDVAVEALGITRRPSAPATAVMRSFLSDAVDVAAAFPMRESSES